MAFFAISIKREDSCILNIIGCKLCAYLKTLNEKEKSPPPGSQADLCRKSIIVRHNNLQTETSDMRV